MTSIVPPLNKYIKIINQRLKHEDICIDICIINLEASQKGNCVTELQI